MAKEKMPNASEKEVLKAVFRTRVFPQNPAGLKITEEEIRKVIQNIKRVKRVIKRVMRVIGTDTHFSTKKRKVI